MQKNKIYSGSGILLLDSYGIILFRNVFTGVYYDLGGTCDANEDIETTAIRECFEESRGLINITLEILRTLYFIDIKHNNTYYRCYILKCKQPIEFDDYKHNITMTDKMKLPKCWYETNNITHFDFKNIQYCFTKKQVCQDHESKYRKIGTRTLNVIKYLLTNKKINIDRLYSYKRSVNPKTKLITLKF